ncbi:hypothetical protein SAY86_011370 [Trapa natans]|uniref:Cationic amino acid transporter C-terminal domain-containing protein n=1 Tax=Trapa natans TaxID=22666 RepID=A0AAN7LWW7_TRANT|nr:hypothetical protein SAY86_011370 [Trapa natans]
MASPASDIPPSSFFCSSPSLAHYLHSLSQTPHRLRKRVFATWTPDQELNQVRLRSGADMKRKLRWYDLTALGVSGMLGAGVFVTTGRVAHSVSGPSVFISYLIAAVSALLSSLCYAEFAVQVPVAGGAFSYLRVTFAGEFVGYFAGANILMEYVLSNAAVARSFTNYLCGAVGQRDPNQWRVELTGLTGGDGPIMLDFPAVALILLLTLCLCHSTKESSILNMIMTVFHVLLFGFIIVAGFCNGSAKNLVEPGGLAPFGAKGIFDGAAIVYFSYIGYDSVSTMAEEIQDPSRTLPISIVGSMVIVSAVYCLMALSLCIMVPYDRILPDTSFAAAFEKIGWKWASNLVAAGASLGIVGSLLVAMLGQARYLCVIGRARLVPSWLARVHPSTGTPLNATLFLGVCTAMIAVFTELDVIFEMISLSTLLVFYLVANALIYRRHVISAAAGRPLHALLFLFLLSSGSLGFSVSWKFSLLWCLALFGGFVIAVIAFFHCSLHPVTTAATDGTWTVPLMPWPAAVSIFMSVFLMTMLKALSFQRFAVWTCLITLFYVLYGVHSTYEAEEMESVIVGPNMGAPPANPSLNNTKVEIVQVIYNP